VRILFIVPPCPPGSFQFEFRFDGAIICRASSLLAEEHLTERPIADALSDRRQMQFQPFLSIMNIAVVSPATQNLPLTERSSASRI
jgi:hypothetical protein